MRWRTDHAEFQRLAGLKYGGGKQEGASGRAAGARWYPQVESNHQFALRRGVLYPFNYGGSARQGRIVPLPG